MKYKDIKRNVVRALVAIAGLNVFTACYGMPYDYYYPTKAVSGTVVDDNDAPIMGIEVSCDGGVIDTTGVDGKFANVVTVGDAGTVISLYFRDIDGTENGEFKNLTIDTNALERDNGKVVLLQRKE